MVPVIRNVRTAIPLKIRIHSEDKRERGAIFPTISSHFLSPLAERSDSLCKEAKLNTKLQKGSSKSHQYRQTICHKAPYAISRLWRAGNSVRKRRFSGNKINIDLHAMNAAYVWRTISRSYWPARCQTISLNDLPRGVIKRGDKEIKENRYFSTWWKEAAASHYMASLLLQYGEDQSIPTGKNENFSTTKEER